jgi:hypothetical protein
MRRRVRGHFAPINRPDAAPPRYRARWQCWFENGNLRVIRGWKESCVFSETTLGK